MAEIKVGADLSQRLFRSEEGNQVTWELNWVPTHGPLDTNDNSAAVVASCLEKFHPVDYKVMTTGSVDGTDTSLAMKKGDILIVNIDPTHEVVKAWPEFSKIIPVDGPSQWIYQIELVVEDPTNNIVCIGDGLIS